MLAIIGGSGLTALANLDVSHREIVRTPYGEPSGPVTFGRLGGQDALFLPRHGYGYSIPPHRVNYRANLWALKDVGASGIISVASVACISESLSPGDIVVPDQIIDYTWGRRSTYSDGDDGVIRQVDFAQPYVATMRGLLVSAAQALGIVVHHGGVYAAIQGPRLETVAEARRYARDGADLIGMTGMPEAALACELALPYAAINLVTNRAAGLRGVSGELLGEEVQAILRAQMEKVRDIARQAVMTFGMKG